MSERVAVQLLKDGAVVHSLIDEFTDGCRRDKILASVACSDLRPAVSARPFRRAVTPRYRGGKGSQVVVVLDTVATSHAKAVVNGGVADDWDGLRLLLEHENGLSGLEYPRAVLVSDQRRPSGRSLLRTLQFRVGEAEVNEYESRQDVVAASSLAWYDVSGCYSNTVSSFDSGAYLEILDGTQTGLDLDVNYTLAGWCKIPSVAGERILVSKFNWSNNQRAYQLSVNGSALKVIVSGNGAGTAGVERGAVTSGEWVHFAFTKAGSEGRLFVNGQQAGTDFAVSTQTHNSTAPFRLGADWLAASANFDGELADVGIWTRALSIVEVSELAQSRVVVGDLEAGLQTGLLSWWSLNGRGPQHVDIIGDNDLQQAGTVNPVSGPVELRAGERALVSRWESREAGFTDLVPTSLASAPFVSGDAVEWDATAGAMVAAGQVTQPNTLHVVHQRDSGIAYLMDTTSTEVATRQFLIDDGSLRAWAGAYLSAGNYANGSKRFVIAEMDGANSAIQVGGDTVLGDAGASGLGALTVGRRFDGASAWTGKIWRVAIFADKLSAADKALLLS